MVGLRALIVSVAGILAVLAVYRGIDDLTVAYFLSPNPDALFLERGLLELFVGGALFAFGAYWLRRRNHKREQD